MRLQEFLQDNPKMTIDAGQQADTIRCLLESGNTVISGNKENKELSLILALEDD